MPPAVSETESDSNGEDVIMPKKKQAQTVKPELMDQDMPSDEEEGDEDELVYVVEKILNHFKQNGIWLYEVKWKGYGENENTWEPEENLEGAVDILEKYFKEIGGRPKPDHKKRGRKSMASETPEPKTKKAKAGANGSARGRRHNTDDLDVWPIAKAKDNWQPPKPLKDAWEDLIISVETIEANEDGTKWAFLLWAVEDEHGKKRTSKALLQSVYKAAPQAMLRFYESHLVFTTQTPADKPATVT